MRPRARPTIALLSLIAALSPRTVGATTCSGIASTCINDDTLWPQAGPTRFVAVGSTETVASQQISFALVTSYLSRPIVLHLATPGSSNSVEAFAVDDQVNSTFAWSYGVTSRLELAVALPLTLGQSGLGLSPVTGGTGLHDTATRDMRFGFAYTLVDQKREPLRAGEVAWGLAGRFDVSAPTGDDDEFAGEHMGVINPAIAASVAYDRYFAGAELGARLRPTTQLLGARVGSQLVAEVGVGAEIMPKELLSVTAEAWALPTFAEQADISVESGQYVSAPNGHHITPSEWLLSLESAPVHDGDLSFQVSGGGSLPLDGESVVTAPRFRFTLGIRWAPRTRH